MLIIAANTVAGHTRCASFQRTQAPRAILRKNRSVCAAIKARADPLSAVVFNQFQDLPLGHGRQVVNVQIAFSAMSHAFVAHHLFPVGWTG
ncbi:MAG TPA: hypothetical protein VKV30_01175 [Candidatus Angelobacter sp.]|nr:hypothetical protein [Candidatus Angelobacter sp.]